MAASYEAAATALMSHCENIADAIKNLLALETRPDVAGIPDPSLGAYAVWLELPERSSKGTVAYGPRDEELVPIDVGVSFPYDVQRDRPLTAWKVADILSGEFPDQFLEDDVLRHSRTGGLSISQGQARTNGPVLVTARMRLSILVSSFN